MSEQEEAFPKVWESFCHLDTVSDGRHDTPEWRSHAGAFAVCIIRVPTAAVMPRLGELRGALFALSGIRLHPDHFLHISLQELGFVTDQPRHEDELSPSELEEFVTLAAGPVGERPPFLIRLGGASSFHDAPFLEVHDDEQSSRLHQRLYEISAGQRSPRFSYLPHVTIGHYTAPTPAAAAIEVLSRWQDTLFGEFEVTEVEIATLATNEPYPEFQPYALFPLAG
jgi:2'-5' RNA ligase